MTLGTIFGQQTYSTDQQTKYKTAHPSSLSTPSLNEYLFYEQIQEVFTYF